MFCRLIALVVLAAFPAVTSAQNAFARGALAEFDRWDTDHDDRLTLKETLAVLLDRNIRADRAAVAAGLITAICRPEAEGGLQPVTKSELRSRERLFTDAVIDVPTEQVSRVDESAAVRYCTPEEAYATAMIELHRADHDLFEGGQPRLGQIRQGALGTCYLIASVAALAYHDADRIEHLVQMSRGTKGYRVTWGDGTSTDVDTLTDGEIAMPGASMVGGVWMRALEKGFAARAYPKLDGREQLLTPYIGQGGDPAVVISLLTGHEARRGQLAAHLNLSSTGLSSLRSAVRTVLRISLPQNRLLVCGTPAAVNVPGILPRHAYAVLAWNESADTVTLFDPHGLDFTPPARNAGYPMKAGVFTLPVSHFTRIFDGLYWETERPLKQITSSADAR